MRKWRLLLLYLVSFIATEGFSGGGPVPAPEPRKPAFQLKQYVTWSFSQKKLSADEYELIFKATIEPGWHLYSQIETPDGPLPTVFEFEKSDAYKLIGKTKEPTPHESREPMFDNQLVRSFEKEAVFRQTVRAISGGTFEVKGIIDGMACNETQCQKFSPPEEFAILIRHEGEAKASPAPSVDIHPSDGMVEVVNPSMTDTDSVSKSGGDSGNEPQLRQAPKKRVEPAVSHWGIFFAGFVGGLLALLTPCVFPMIPMTVSFFIKQSKTKSAGIRNAFIYAISIIAIYITLGLGVTLIFGADAVNKLATDVWFNLAFFVLLVIFAISFLGAFEITLPSSFVNKMDARSDRGGFVGIFFMAFTLGLVSFSCTGPIIGTLLVQTAATRELLAPFLGMLGFSLALALPFGLFAAFPGWLNSLPKSGGWLNSVKVVLGFLELALALKFLSNADLVVQAQIITREVFLVLWIVIFALLGAYLMGWFRLSHDSELKHISVGRLLFAVIVFAFTFYLVPGLWGAPLKLISGFPPPTSNSESPTGFGSSGGASERGHGGEQGLPAGAHRGPHGIPTFHDYFIGREYSRKVNKPILLDFTGWACVNCRRMEERVWSDPEVKRRLSEEFVLVSLYVDEKSGLPENLREEVMWNGKKRRLRSVGDRWSYLQNTKYEDSTQPRYWIIDADENRFGESTSYDPDIGKYLQWMDNGQKLYREKHPG